MMDLRKIKKLIELLEESALSEMEITEGENTIRLSRAAPPAAAIALAPAPMLAAPTAETPTAAPPTPEPPAAPPGKVVVSPLVGTFYHSQSPQDAPYVTVGSTVKTGDTLCLIEAMKTFNQLDAEIAGVITLVYKENGEPVEFGEPLFVIAPAE